MNKNNNKNETYSVELELHNQWAKDFILNDSFFSFLFYLSYGKRNKHIDNRWWWDNVESSTECGVCATRIQTVRKQIEAESCTCKSQYDSCQRNDVSIRLNFAFFTWTEEMTYAWFPRHMLAHNSIDKQIKCNLQMHFMGSIDWSTRACARSKTIDSENK